MPDTDGARARRRLGAPAELLLLDPSPSAVRLATAVLGVALAAGWGFAALALHEHELGVLEAGDVLNPVGQLFADGSSAVTAWPGWVAAAVVGLSAARLRGRRWSRPPAAAAPGS